MGITYNSALLQLSPVRTMEGRPDLGVPKEEAEVKLTHITIIVAERVCVLLCGSTPDAQLHAIHCGPLPTFNWLGCIIIC